MARFTQNVGGTGSALNYVQVAGAQQTISSAPNAIIDLDITTTGKPVQISATGEGSNAAAGSWVRINLFRDGTAIGNEMQLEASAVSENVPFAINFIDDVAAGTYNYSVVVTSIAGGNWQFGEASGPVMNAVELTGFKGDDGSSGGDIADFVFNYDEEDTNSVMTIHNHDMVIQTTRDTDEDADISLNSADDIWINATDDIEISASNSIYLSGTNGVYLGITEEGENNPNNQVATIGDIQSASIADFAFTTVDAPDYESTMTITNKDMVIKTVVDTEANGNIRVESTQNLTLDANGDILLESKNGSDIVKARITLDQSNEQVLIEAIDPNDSFFDDTQWATAVWTGTAITITNTPDIINFFDNAPGTVSDVSVNNGVLVTYQGASYGSGNITIDVGGTPAEGEDPLTITSIRFYYPIISKIDIDYDNGSFDIDAKNMPIDMSSTAQIDISSGDDVTITAGGDDLRLRAWDDITFTAGYNNGDQYEWRMNNNGRFELPASGYIQNPNNASSDGSGLDTLHLVPDFEAIDAGTDQYIIIEPTSPNHIHIRSGGTIDNSNAYLILGGEKNNVIASDADRNVYINSRYPLIMNSYTNLDTQSSTAFAASTSADIQVGYTVNVGGTDYTVTAVEPFDEGVVVVYADGAVFDGGGSYTFTYDSEYTNQWTFSNDGTLYGPGEGGLTVTNLYGQEGDNVFNVVANQNLVLTNGDGYGAYLNDSNSGLNQIATIGDLDAVTEQLTPGEESFVVNGGTTATQPTFNGSPLFSGTYVKTGPMVHFQIQVDMDNITNFGTGQYYVDLPFDAKYGYQFKEGCLHDISASNQYALGGHVYAGTNRLFLTYTGSNGQDELFDHDSPISLNVADNFHISGTYISQ